MSSLVLEKSETLRTDGVCIAVHANGWRALDQLGIGTELREITSSITGYAFLADISVYLDVSKQKLLFYILLFLLSEVPCMNYSLYKVIKIRI